MARFCKYCGKRLDDSECDCPEAVAEREALAEKERIASESGSVSAADSSDQEGTAAETTASDITDNAASKSRVEEVLGPAGAEVALNLRDLIVGMFTNPVKTLEEDVRKKDRTSPYIIAAVLSVLTFLVIAIIGDTPLVNEAIGRGKLVIFALVMALAAFILKAVYAACITFWGRKYNPGLTYSAALGTFCVLGIYDIVMLLIFTLAAILSIYEFCIAIIIFWIIMTTICCLVATRVLTEGKAESVVRINLVLLFIFTFLLVLALRGIVVEMLAGALFAIIDFLGAF